MDDVLKDDRNFRRKGRKLYVDLWYPTVDAQPNEIIVGLCHVRCADKIRITYDFDRDGWCIQQAQRFTWPAGDACDPMWKEVAFVDAWGSEDKEWSKLMGWGDE